MILASNVTQGAAISGWNGLHGSMGPRGHTQWLELVIGALPALNESEMVAGEGSVLA